MGISSLPIEYKKLANSSECIENGYGEFLVYHQDASLSITEESYKEIFALFNKYLYNPEVETENLTETLRAKVEELNANLRIAFIPRTLYDLCYVVASIEEDKSANCPMQWFDYRGDKELHKEKFKDQCWHIIHSTDENPICSDDSYLIHLAYRLNQLCIEKTKFSPPFFTGKQVVSITEDLLQQLIDHRKGFSDVFWGETYTASRGAAATRHYEMRGVAVNFGLSNKEGSLVVCLPMGICNQNDAQVLRNAVALECHQIAHNALVLYRGGDLVKERALMSLEASLSYGSSLLAGCTRDGTATVLHYILGDARSGYACVVPFSKWIDAPYITPALHSSLAVVQLLAEGEFFHPRSVVPTSSLKISQKWVFARGVYACLNSALLQKLVVEMTPEELAHQVNGYHQNTYELTDFTLNFS